MWQIEVTVVFDHEGDVIDMFHKNVSNCGLHAELEWEETGSSPTNLEAPRGAFGMITLEFPHVIVKSVRIQWCREMRFNFWSQPLPGEWKEDFLWGRCVRHGGAPPGFPLREGLDPELWGLGSSGSHPQLSAWSESVSVLKSCQALPLVLKLTISAWCWLFWWTVLASGLPDGWDLCWCSPSPFLHFCFHSFRFWKGWSLTHISTKLYRGISRELNLWQEGGQGSRPGEGNPELCVTCWSTYCWWFSAFYLGDI